MEGRVVHTPKELDIQRNGSEMERAGHFGGITHTLLSVSPSPRQHTVRLGDIVINSILCLRIWDSSSPCSGYGQTQTDVNVARESSSGWS
jgi:hypothetical protein